MVSSPVVGFIGPGQMGRPMVTRLLGAGRQVVVHARRPDVSESLRSQGAVVVASSGEVVAAADVVVCCLFSDEQLRQVLLTDGALAHAHPGTVVASHVTGHMRLLQELAAAAPAGVEIVDAPVSGSAPEILDGRLTILLGGSPDAVQRVEAVVAAYGDPVMRCGALGHAMAIKLINNALFSAHLRLAGEAQRIAHAMGVGSAELVAAVSKCSGASAALARLGANDFAVMEPHARPFLMKDVAVVEDVLEELGVDLGELGEVLRPYRHP